MNNLKSWYDEKVPIYRPLVERLENMVKEILDKEAIEYVHIEARLKKFKRIKTIADLNEIIRPDINQFKSKYAEASKPKDYVSFSALIRDILIISDPDGYFKKAWKHHYNTPDYHSWKVYEKFEVDKSNFPPASELEFEEGSDKD